MDMNPLQSVFSNNGCCQNANGLIFPTINLPFAPNCEVTATSATAPAPQSPAPPTSSRPTLSNSGRRPCHHASYVLNDKPTRPTVLSKNIECSNCGTKNTSAWRRSADGESECNACNLFFRKNGRKRPASMRRDTIARRYRLSRCELCMVGTQKSSSDSDQFRKPAARHGQNSETSSKTTVAEDNTIVEDNTTLSSSGLNHLESAAAHNFFVPNPSFAPQSAPMFVAPNMQYNHQTPLTMMDTSERTMFRIMNLEEQRNQAEVDTQPSYSRDYSSAFSTSLFDVFGQPLLIPASSAAANVIEQEAVGEMLSSTDHHSQYPTGDLGKEASEGLTGYHASNDIVRPDVINCIQFESQYSRPYFVMKCDNDFVNCSTTARESPLGVEPSTTADFINTPNRPFNQ